MQTVSILKKPYIKREELLEESQIFILKQVLVHLSSDSGCLLTSVIYSTPQTHSNRSQFIISIGSPPLFSKEKNPDGKNK